MPTWSEILGELKEQSQKDPTQPPFDFAITRQTGKFILNYRKGRIDISKRNHHFRGRNMVGLARLDLDGKPHRNPDKTEVGPRHLHLYREGYNLKWAFEIPRQKKK